jgi:hypothetical protein
MKTRGANGAEIRRSNRTFSGLARQCDFVLQVNVPQRPARHFDIARARRDPGRYPDWQWRLPILFWAEVARFGMNGCEKRELWQPFPESRSDGDDHCGSLASSFSVGISRADGHTRTARAGPSKSAIHGVLTRRATKVRVVIKVVAIYTAPR